MCTKTLPSWPRRPAPWSAFFLLSLFAAALSAATQHCTTVIVGRLASADGSVLLAHNEDLQAKAAQHLVSVPRLRHPPGETIVLWSGARVPQAPETFAFLGTMIFDKELIPGDLVAGINEHQVAVANNLAFQRDAAEDLRAGRMIWSEFMRIALERARTAREAVHIIGECAQLYKLASDPGTMFGITDPVEGWWLEVAQEGQWVAQRVPDQGFAMRANAYRIGAVDFDDPQNYLFSADLVAHAVQRGWYTPLSGEVFHFSEVYALKSDAHADYNTHRQERADQLLIPQLPEISASGLAGLLRDHYEDSPYDHSGGPNKVSPHRTDERTICCTETVASVVAQSRGWLPPEIGGVFWLAMSPPCTGTFIPWHPGADEIPAPFQSGGGTSSEDSAYWAFRRLVTLADRDYQEKIAVIRARWSALEKTVERDLPLLEEKARRLYAEDRDKAVRLLNDESAAWAAQAFAIARRLAEEIE